MDEQERLLIQANERLARQIERGDIYVSTLEQVAELAQSAWLLSAQIKPEELRTILARYLRAI